MSSVTKVNLPTKERIDKPGTPRRGERKINKGDNGRTGTATGREKGKVY